MGGAGEIGLADNVSDAVFAENNTLVYLTATLALVALDTTDPTNIKKTAMPLNLPAAVTDSYWGFTVGPALGGANGLDFFALRADCTTDPCKVRLSRYAVTPTTVTAGPTAAIGDVALAVKSNRGAVTFDRVVGGPVVVLPNKDVNTAGATATVARYSRTNLTQGAEVFPFPQAADDNSRLALDHCQPTALISGVKESAVRLIPLVSAGIAGQNWDTSVNVQGLYYEPFTDKVLSRFQAPSQGSLSAAQVGGTDTQPKANSSSWNYPAGLIPTAAAVANPDKLVCKP